MTKRAAETLLAPGGTRLAPDSYFKI